MARFKPKKDVSKSAAHRRLKPDFRGAQARYEIFVREYLIDLNASRAARAAGYSPRTAGQTADRLLKTDKIRKMLAALTQKRCEKLDITAERVLTELARLGFSRLTDQVAWGPRGVKVIPSGELSDSAVAAVAEVSQHDTKEGRQIKVKLHDKKGALEVLARHLGLLKDNINVNLIQPLVIERSDGTKLELTQVRKEGSTAAEGAQA